MGMSVVDAVPEGMRVSADVPHAAADSQINFDRLNPRTAEEVEIQLAPEKISTQNKFQLKQDLERGLQLGDYKWPSPDNLSDEAHKNAVGEYVSNILSDTISQEVLDANPGLGDARKLAEKIIPYYSQNLSYVAYKAISPDASLGHTDLPKTLNGGLPAFFATPIYSNRYYFNESGWVRFSSSLQVVIKSAGETQIEALGIIDDKDMVVLGASVKVDMAYGENLLGNEVTEERKKSLTITIENEETPRYGQKSILRALMTDETPAVSAYIHEQFKPVASEAPALMRRHAPDLLAQLTAYEKKKAEFEQSVTALLAEDDEKQSAVLSRLKIIDQKSEAIKNSFKSVAFLAEPISRKEIDEFKTDIDAVAGEIDGLENEYFPELNQAKKSRASYMAQAKGLKKDIEKIDVQIKELRRINGTPRPKNEYLQLAESPGNIDVPFNLAEEKYLGNRSTDGFKADVSQACSNAKAGIQKLTSQKEDLQKNKDELIEAFQKKFGLDYCIQELDKKIKELEGRIFLKADSGRIGALNELLTELKNMKTAQNLGESQQEMGAFISNYITRKKDALNATSKIFGVIGTTTFFSKGQTRTFQFLNKLEAKAKVMDNLIRQGLVASHQIRGTQSASDSELAQGNGQDSMSKAKSEPTLACWTAEDTRGLGQSEAEVILNLSLGK